MRHRILGADICGLGGNNDPELLDNNWTDNKQFNAALKECLLDALSSFKTLEDIGGVDFQINKSNGTISFGYEPAYKFENLFIICIDFKDINNCYIRRGKAWGYYGTNIVSTTRYYHQYKNECKFTKYVKRVHSKLYDLWKKLNEV